MMSPHVSSTPEAPPPKPTSSRTRQAGWRSLRALLPVAVAADRRRTLTLWALAGFILGAVAAAFASTAVQMQPAATILLAVLSGLAVGALVARIALLSRPRRRVAQPRNDGRVPLAVQDVFESKIDPASASPDTQDFVRASIAEQRQTLPAFILGELIDVASSVCLALAALLIPSDGFPFLSIVFAVLALTRLGTATALVHQLGRSALLLDRLDNSPARHERTPE